MGTYYAAVHHEQRLYFRASDVGPGFCKAYGVPNPTFCAMVTWALARDSGWRILGDGEWDPFDHQDYANAASLILFEMRIAFAETAGMPELMMADDYARALEAAPPNAKRLT